MVSTFRDAVGCSVSLPSSFSSISPIELVPQGPSTLIDSTRPYHFVSIHGCYTVRLTSGEGLSP